MEMLISRYSTMMHYLFFFSQRNILRGHSFITTVWIMMVLIKIILRNNFRVKSSNYNIFHSLLWFSQKYSVLWCWWWWWYLTNQRANRLLQNTPHHCSICLSINICIILTFEEKLWLLLATQQTGPAKVCC